LVAQCPECNIEVKKIAGEKRRKEGKDYLFLQCGIGMKMFASGIEDGKIEEPKKGTDMGKLYNSNERSLRKRLWWWVTG
jgi:hypothetical protein